MAAVHGTVGEVATRLADMFNLGKAAGWDPVGLQLGDPGAPVSRVAVCYEITPGVTARLEESPVDLVVSYHPLLFRPARSLVAGSGAAGRAFRLIRAGIALVVTHTAFDVAPGGTADRLAQALGLGDITGFGPAWGPECAKVVTFAPPDAVEGIAAAMAAEGAGIIGRYTNCSRSRISCRAGGSPLWSPPIPTKTPHTTWSASDRTPGSSVGGDVCNIPARSTIWQSSSAGDWVA